MCVNCHLLFSYSYISNDCSRTNQRDVEQINFLDNYGLQKPKVY